MTASTERERERVKTNGAVHFWMVCQMRWFTSVFGLLLVLKGRGSSARLNRPFKLVQFYESMFWHRLFCHKWTSAFTFSAGNHPSALIFTFHLLLFFSLSLFAHTIVFYLVCCCLAFRYLILCFNARKAFNLASCRCDQSKHNTRAGYIPFSSDHRTRGAWRWSRQAERTRCILKNCPMLELLVSYCCCCSCRWYHLIFSSATNEGLALCKNPTVSWKKRKEKNKMKIK